MVKEIYLFLVILILIISPIATHAKCDVEAVVKYVNELMSPLPGKKEIKLNDIKIEVHDKCDGITTQEGCSLSEVINYAIRGKKVKEIKEKCK